MEASSAGFNLNPNLPAFPAPPPFEEVIHPKDKVWGAGATTIVSSKRLDGRDLTHLRLPEFHFLNWNDTSGACQYRQGLGAVITAIRGPQNLMHTSSTLSTKSIPESMQIFVYIQPRIKTIPRQYKKYEAIIKKFIYQVVDVKKYNLCTLNVYIQILSEDGPLTPLFLNSVYLTLLNAAIPMFKVCYAVAIGIQKTSMERPLSHLQQNVSSSSKSYSSPFSDSMLKLCFLLDPHEEEVLNKCETVYSIVYNVKTGGVLACIAEKLGMGLTLEEMEQMHQLGRASVIGLDNVVHAGIQKSFNSIEAFIKGNNFFIH